MNEQLRAFQLSLGLHAGLILAVAVANFSLAPGARTVVLDLSLLAAAPPAPERPLHPRARFDPVAPAPAPKAAPEEVRPQVQRVNVTQEQAPVAAAPGVPPAEPEQAPGLPRDALRERYLSRNFSGIRDRINAGLVYPAIARKMGWSGRVLVSFVVLTDGRVRNVRVREGCGHDVLDRSAVEAVKRCAPYPPPPEEAELLVPITYRLE
ncbi:MAG: hypothetical protein A2X32_03395 [Elusimicrobia bacterium GWC2_64_44]|nr:MAG: hypothetical protein A2X32_03395 [Elusimicrobia bacterium GWC2_64_44]